MALRRIKSAWQMVNGLVTVLDVLGFIGFWLFRGTLKRTIAVAVALLVVVFIGSKTDSDYSLTLQQAFKGTGLIFILSCLGGAALMLVSGSFSKAAMNIAEAKGSNLLEDMKKARKESHRDKLWQRVYRYEQVVVSADERRDELATLAKSRNKLEDACDPNRRRRLAQTERTHLDDQIKRLGTTEDGWRILFEYAIQVPQGLATLSHRLRFKLGKIKDWYDGAPFHASDWKLPIQFDSREDLRQVKTEARLGTWALIMHLRMRSVQQLWFKMITRATQVRVAAACRRFDTRYAPYAFSIDHFLWPSRAIDRVIADQLGPDALAALTAERKKIFATVFHHNVTLAHQLMRKAIYPNFVAATELRRRYDPEYVCGELEDEWSKDLHRYARALGASKRATYHRERIRRSIRLHQNALRLYLDTHPQYNPTGDPEFRRAIRIAYHINRFGLRDLIDAGRDPLEEVDRHWTHRITRWSERKGPRSIDAIIRHLAAEAEQTTQKLLAVRLHHELARLELEDYTFYLDRIMG